MFATLYQRRIVFILGSSQQVQGLHGTLPVMGCLGFGMGYFAGICTKKKLIECSGIKALTHAVCYPRIFLLQPAHHGHERIGRQAHLYIGSHQSCFHQVRVILFTHGFLPYLVEPLKLCAWLVFFISHLHLFPQCSIVLRHRYQCHEPHRHHQNQCFFLHVANAFLQI